MSFCPWKEEGQAVPPPFPALSETKTSNSTSKVLHGGSSGENNTMEAGGDVNTYLQRSIEALERSERQIAWKLQKIQAAGKSCHGWTEQDWKPEKEDDFFTNLEYLLRFLNHYALPEETA
uniref:Uncharacterized protein n=1 Tax=Athene cunicularia TaxID=194338 RepID=A0A663MSH2_ATHCN